MEHGEPSTEYPRSLTRREQEWIEWILPEERAGYRQYREILAEMIVIGEGRRGSGEMILGKSGDQPDFSAPLPPVFAYGLLETDRGEISVTLREVLDDQISVEMVCRSSDTLPDEFLESRRWTYSLWSPGNPCPQCSRHTREITMQTPGAVRYVLAICVHDKRIWVHDGQTGVIKLIPVTNFYNELMLHKNIRDPKIALDHKRFFAELATYTDNDLIYTFSTYNTILPHVHVPGGITLREEEKPSLFRRLKSMFT